ncbi:MAG: PEGA domain-containing protein [Candidatus Omnitrophica bacterium]|nr:PEGA domain-containing protein [Candidatus Omnitrophota bacterium]
MRKIIFYILALVYIISCPLIILYAFGYIYSPGKPGEGGSVLQTGLMYVATVPPGATLQVKGTEHPQTTPATIRDLLPGTYPIAIEMEGYNSWSQDIPVEAEKATVLDKIILLPKKWKEEKLLEGPFTDLAPMLGSGHFLVKGGPNAGNFTVYNYTDDKEIPLLEDGSPFFKDKVLSYYLVDKSSAMLLRVGTSGEEKFLWIEPDEDPGKATDVTSLLEDLPERIKWVPQAEWLQFGEDRLYTYQSGYVNRIDIESGAVYPEYVNEVKGYALFNNEIYVLKENNEFLKMDLNKDNKNKLLDDPELGHRLFGEKGYFEVEVLSDDFILFVGEKGELLANRLPHRFVEGGIRGLKPYMPLEHVLLWKKDSIGILDFSTEETGNVEFEKGPTLTWIYTKGKNIEQCFWVYEGTHILFRDGMDVFLIESEEYGEYILSHLFRLGDKSNINYSDDTKEIYFLEASKGDLVSVNLMPETTVLQGALPAGKNEKK